MLGSIYGQLSKSDPAKSYLDPAPGLILEAVCIEPKIIILDLETLPNLPEALKVWPQLSNYPGLTLKATISTIICGGYKVLGDKKASCLNAWDYPAWRKNVNDDKELVKDLYDIIKTADAIITQNGKSFDWRFLQTRLMYHGLQPLNKIKHIDTKCVAKSNLYAFNNRLGTLGKLLVDDDKLDNGGWQLWVDVHKRDPKAMALMTKYCKQDVNLTEKVFLKLRPLINNIPNFNIYNPEYASGRPVCPKCGSTRIKKNGHAFTSTTSYPRILCKDCGACSRTDKSGRLPRSY